MRKTIYNLFLAGTFVVLSGCSHFSQTDKSQDNNEQTSAAVLPVAIPVQVAYQDEVKLLRINQMIADKEKVDDEQRAVLYYQRGLIYDRMGLTAHSRYDFSQSINLSPSYPDPYNSLGVYLLMGEAYDEAFDAFDSAIELDANMQFSYLHRAIGLSLVERYQGAHEDIEQFYQLDKTDPYRVLWRYLINFKFDQQLAITQLKQAKATGEIKAQHQFAWKIIDVINEQTSEIEFFANIAEGVESNEQLAQRLCEAYYYIGHWHINNGDMNKGIYFLKLSVASNVKEFIEYKYALVDLSMIQRKLQKQEQN